MPEQENNFKIERSKEEKEAELERILIYANERLDKKIEEKRTKNKDDIKIQEIYDKIDKINGSEEKSAPKKSSVSGVVGKISSDTKEDILRKREERFASQKQEKWERKKTQEELRVLGLVNQATNEILQKYGLPNFDIPPENYHVVKKLQESSIFYDDTIGVLGKHVSSLQKNIIKSESVLSAFLATAFHETLHFKSFNSIKITDKQEAGRVVEIMNRINESIDHVLGRIPFLKSFGDNDAIRLENKEEHSRVGLKVVTKTGRSLFDALNEAVTERMNKKYSQRLLSDPLFRKEREETRLETEKQPKETFDEDVYYAVENRNEFTNWLLPSKTKEFGYKSERQALDSLVRKLFVKNQEKFKDEEEIMEMFERAMMTGHIHAIGQLIDKTFGRGTFRKIGECEKNAKELTKFVNAL